MCVCVPSKCNCTLTSKAAQCRHEVELSVLRAALPRASFLQCCRCPRRQQFYHGCLPRGHAGACRIALQTPTLCRTEIREVLIFNCPTTTKAWRTCWWRDGEWAAEEMRSCMRCSRRGNHQTKASLRCPLPILCWPLLDHHADTREETRWGGNRDCFGDSLRPSY